MSRAFVREQDVDLPQTVPHRPIPSGPNDVTAHGLALMDAAVRDAQKAYAAAQVDDDAEAVAAAANELRYWSARRASARVVEMQRDTAAVCFGHAVTIRRDDGREQTFRIVGDDEADPSHGTISNVSPLARALLGKRVGDAVRAGRDDAEILAIST